MIADVGAPRSEDPTNYPYNCFWTNPTYAATVRERHRQTDRQTDGRLTIAIPHHTHTASRGKNAISSRKQENSTLTQSNLILDWHWLASSSTIAMNVLELVRTVEYMRRSVQGRFYGGPGGRGPPMKNVPPVAPHFGPGSLDFHLNRPVISLIQLHIVPPQLELCPPLPPIWLVPEPPLPVCTKWQKWIELCSFQFVRLIEGLTVQLIFPLIFVLSHISG